MKENISFQSIVDLKNWQNMQNHFSDVLCISIVTLDKNGELLSKISCPSCFSEETFRVNMAMMLQCKKYLGDNFYKLDFSHTEEIIHPSGFYNYFIPLNILDTSIGYIFIGPVIVGKRKDNTYYREQAKKIGFTPETFLKAVEEMKTFTFCGIKSVVELLYDIASRSLQLEYENIKLKKKVPEFSKILGEMYMTYREKILSALLDVCFASTEADRGSLMLLDEEKDELYIKKAKGLSKAVIENTKVKIGEGIAGLVAQRKKPFYIDSSIEDYQIRERMHRPQIHSAISAPILLKDKLLGILNLSNFYPRPDKFSSKSIETINRLIRLVETTLLNLPKAKFH